MTTPYDFAAVAPATPPAALPPRGVVGGWVLYTSDAADD
jgi:hypothetical protein